MHQHWRVWLTVILMAKEMRWQQNIRLFYVKGSFVDTSGVEHTALHQSLLMQHQPEPWRWPEPSVAPSRERSGPQKKAPASARAERGRSETCGVTLQNAEQVGARDYCSRNAALATGSRESISANRRQEPAFTSFWQWEGKSYMHFNSKKTKFMVLLLESQQESRGLHKG